MAGLYREGGNGHRPAGGQANRGQRQKATGPEAAQCRKIGPEHDDDLEFGGVETAPACRADRTHNGLAVGWTLPLSADVAMSVALRRRLVVGGLLRQLGLSRGRGGQQARAQKRTAARDQGNATQQPPPREIQRSIARMTCHVLVPLPRRARGIQCILAEFNSGNGSARFRSSMKKQLSKQIVPNPVRYLKISRDYLDKLQAIVRDRL